MPSIAATVAAVMLQKGTSARTVQSMQVLWMSRLYGEGITFSCLFLAGTVRSHNLVPMTTGAMHHGSHEHVTVVTCQGQAPGEFADSGTARPARRSGEDRV